MLANGGVQEEAEGGDDEGVGPGEREVYMCATMLIVTSR